MVIPSDIFKATSAVIKGSVMSKWAEVAITLLGAALIAYATLQTHEVRLRVAEQDISKLDDKLDKHIALHEQQNRDLIDRMTKMQLDIQSILTTLKMEKR